MSARLKKKATPNAIHLVLALAALFSLVLLAACEESKASAPAMQRPPAPVTVSRAIQQDVPVYIDAIGKTAAREVVAIQPQVSGRITEIHFADGADLKPGDKLFTIDPRPYTAQVHSAEANLAQARADLNLANTDYSRMVGLADAHAISQQLFDSKKNDVAVDQAKVQQAEAALETARLNLDYCYIRSPIQGRAGQRLVDRGNIVSPTSGAMLTIERLDPVYADFTITENELDQLQQSMQHGNLKTEVRLPDDDHAREGALTFLDNSVQDGTGTVKLRATLANPDHFFWPGRFVRIRLILSTEKAAVLVPAVAPQTSAKGTFVYVIKPDSTAELRPVTTGQREGDLIVIDKGVKPGEQVVTAGQLGVTPGGKVMVSQNAQPGGKS